MTNDNAVTNGQVPADALPETPHELPIDRTKLDELLAAVKRGTRVDLLSEFLRLVDWQAAFGRESGAPLAAADIERLATYYREKFADVGPVYLAELLSTEFITEQRARGEIIFSERLLELGRTEPQLWQEIRQFFRRKELVTALLVAANQGPPQ